MSARRSAAAKRQQLLQSSSSKIQDRTSSSTMLMATKDTTQNNTLNLSHLPLPPPATPLTTLSTLQLQLYDAPKILHRFVILNGATKTEMNDYLAFKQYYCLKWGNIVTIIKKLEELCQLYSIPVGIVSGDKVAELARFIDVDQKPTLEDLLDTFLNKEDVEKLVRTPGRQFKRKDGAHLAAIKIQCAWRSYRDRQAYVQYRKKKWAACVIAMTWLTYCKMTKARNLLKTKRAKNLDNFRRRFKELCKAWPRLKSTKRTIIHIASLGYTTAVRENMKNLPMRENYQMARLCDIYDENVDVIYVTSVPVTEETLQYYAKLLGLKTAVQSGNASHQADVSNRYKIVVPEALNSFPMHNMALSTLLKYSPKALERIKNLIKGRDAYIVPGVMNHDDLEIADILNVPILGCEPEIANLYTTKSGSKRTFQSAKVPIPYGEFDIYNKQQLYECLAQEITSNLIVQRWLFKIDDECDGRGIAYCDIAKHLSCYNWALKEMAKFGDKWSKKWAHEPAYVKILEELPELLDKFAQPSNTEAYASWDVYLKAFLAQGGVIEAYPPSDSVTSLTVSVLIEPDSNVKILSSGDHIHAESLFSCWGVSFPQTSVEAQEINDACLRIAEACKQRHIVGYVDIDFVTFIDPNTEKQILWATDLNISYSDNVAMTSLINYMTNGLFDSAYHTYEVSLVRSPPAEKSSKKSQNVVVNRENNARYAVISNRLYHSNLAVVHYSVFFQTCRARGIGYDIKEKQGTIFTLVDSLSHVNMGMITISDNLQTSMLQFANNLSGLHHEISSNNMQGKTNFLLAVKDLKSTLGSANENETDENN